MQRNTHPRPRDFYDVCTILDTGVDPTSQSMRHVWREVFAAKDVQLASLAHLPSTRDFHEREWPSVKASVGQSIGAFEGYFERVCSVAAYVLKTLGDE